MSQKEWWMAPAGQAKADESWWEPNFAADFFRRIGESAAR
jgi:hypothetical protein